MNIAELLAVPAMMYPAHTILEFEGETFSFAELEQKIDQATAGLRAIGVSYGDRVALLATNTTNAVVTIFACARIGAVTVPLNYRAHATELQGMLDIANPSTLLVDDRYLDMVRQMSSVAERFPRIVASESAQPDLPHLLGLASSGGGGEPFEVSHDDLAALMFTSGTSSAPKAVMLTHGGLTTFVFDGTDICDGSDMEAVLLCAPLYHVAGFTAALTASFAGRRIVLTRQFEPGEWLRLAGERHVTHAFLVPTMLRQVLDHPAFDSTDLSDLRFLSYGAAPMPIEVITEAIERMPPTVSFVNAFGQTETTSTVTMLGPEDHVLTGPPEVVERNRRRLHSIGRPVAGVEIRIVDETGNPVASGAVGEIAIRSGRIMRGYFGQEEESRASIIDGWLRTRDLGRIDEDGYVFLEGRSSDLIIRGGENVSPDEVEAVLRAHPGVQDAAVVGIPDGTWGEVVFAAVVRGPGTAVTAAELHAHCGSLARYKRPEQFTFLADLPRNSMGKLLRREVRKEVDGYRAVDFRSGQGQV